LKELILVGTHLITEWAVDFETPVGSTTFFSFFSFSWAASAEKNKK
jgi:hypothetical protein